MSSEQAHKPEFSDLFNQSPGGVSVRVLDLRSGEGGHVFISHTALEGQTPIGRQQHRAWTDHAAHVA